MYTNVNLQRINKLILELFIKSQKYAKANFALRDKVLKAWNLDLYYDSSHIEYYYFCRQYKDYFDTANVISA